MELKQQVEQFIRSRPDLSLFIGQLSTNQNSEINYDNDEEPYFSSEKEEIISENLNFCLENSILDKLPINIFEFRRTRRSFPE